ncbi:MAG: CDP-diacylglycerol--serine O-phosphatidyltransferase [Bacteroidia bacterium]
MNKNLLNLPNLLTSINLVCGVLAIINVVTSANVQLVAILIFTSLVCDFLDGFVARALKINSLIGKELDSLADVVTFGVFPAVLMCKLIGESTSASFAWNFESYLPYVGLIIAAFSALRLAKFNLDERQSDCFYGLATPANTIFVLSFWLVKSYHPTSALATFLQNTYLLIGLTLILSYLLISEVKLIAFKFKDFSWEKNKYRFMIMAVSVVLIAILGVLGIPFAMIAYIGISVLQNILEPKN